LDILSNGAIERSIIREHGALAAEEDQAKERFGDGYHPVRPNYQLRVHIIAHMELRNRTYVGSDGWRRGSLN
jgi:hypothetical protein